MTAEAPDIEYVPFDEPSTEILDDSAEKPRSEFLEDTKKRSKRAERYEEKIKGFFQTGFAITAKNHHTQPDAAALVMYGPTICEKWGDLADADPRVRKGIDFLTEGTENPYLAAAVTTLPLVMQLMRNHEKDLEVKQRGIRVPFTQRRFGFKFGVKLGFLHRTPGTVEPEFLTKHVFTDPDIQEKLAKLGIKARFE